MVEELTQANFKDTVSKGNVVIDFWAEWCHPCKMFAPIFEEVASEEQDITFAKVDTEANQEVAQELGIRAIPTTIFFKDGKEVDRQSGAMMKPQFKEKLKEVFGND